MARKKKSGDKHPTVTDSRHKVYEKLKKKMSVGQAARIANAGKTRAKRSAMAKKSAATRRRRGR